VKINAVTVDRYNNADAPTSDYGSEIVVVNVATDNDLTGFDFCSTSALGASLLETLITKVIAPLINNCDPRETDALWTRMYQALPRRGGDGIMRNAIAAVDFALWDIKGKALNEPVWKLLGGNRTLVPTYVNCAHHLPVDELAKRAASYVERGHKAMKIRGTRSFVTLAEATQRVQAVREAIGPEIRLMVDVNGSWDVDTAIQQLKTWQPHQVYWLEEPVAPDNIKGYARVRARSGDTYIAGGEQHAGTAEFQMLIDSGGIDIAQPNAALTGGITDFLRIHAYASGQSVPVSPWNLQQIHIHLAAGLPNIQWIEYFMADNALLEFQGKLIKGSALEEVVQEDGVYLKAPTAPGLGIEVDAAFGATCKV